MTDIKEIERVLTLLGRKYLTKRGQEVISQALVDGERLVARIILLEAIDTNWFANRLTLEEAKRDYRLLGLPKEVACEIRKRQYGATD